MKMRLMLVQYVLYTGVIKQPLYLRKADLAHEKLAELGQYRT